MPITTISENHKNYIFSHLIFLLIFASKLQLGGFSAGTTCRPPSQLSSKTVYKAPR